MKSGQIKAGEIERAADMLKALGHPIRLRIALALLQGDCNVKTMWQRLDLPQATVSQHLTLLKAKGVVKSRREGVKMCYSVADDLATDVLRAFIKQAK